MRLLSAAVGAMAVTASASGATLHVSSAAGGEGDGSAAAPFARVRDAVEAAAAGDTIIVRKGSYRTDEVIRIETAGVKIVGVSGERPVIGAGDQLRAVFEIVADGVVLQDLAIQGGHYSVKVDVGEGDRPTRGVVIRDCAIGGSAADCVKSFNADELTIEGCQIGPSGWKDKENAEGIDVIGSIGVVVRGCTFEEIATNAVYFKGGTRNGVVERCLIRKAGHAGILLGQDTDLEAMRNGVEHEAIDCVARNNIVVDTRAAGVGTYSGKNIRFINNTLVNVAKENQAGVWIVANGRNVPAENISVRNNIVAVGGDRPLMFVKDAAGLPDSDHNVFSVARGQARFVREMSAAESLNAQWSLPQWQKSAGRDLHSVLGDPKVDLRQFRPMAGSPAIGAADGASRPEDDYFGKRRSGDRSDAGAVLASSREMPAAEISGGRSAQ